MGKVVGIDLGTTNSVVAVMEGGKPVVIANSEGMRTTPSVIAFTKDEERLVGQMARRQSVLNPQNTYYGVKRYIGRRYSELSAELKRVAYTIRKDEYDAVRIKCPRLRKEFAPEELSSMVLRKLADEATRYLGETVTGAVITVPAYFNDAQRQATRDAGRIAGLEVLRILNEPTAASLAYGLDRIDSQTILVFDLGGGTFDVSILDIGDGVFEVKATSGDTQLGGSDFDRRIVDWLADQFMQQEGMDLRRDRQALQRLMEAAEKAKIELSGVSSTEINLPFITATEDGPKHLETRMTRSQFEELCGDLVNRLRTPVKQALNDTGLRASQIDDVILVGGASRMPMVKEVVRVLLEREPKENINPDEAVAVGAAIQAGILNQEVQDILLLDVTPLSVGLETIGGVMKKLIPRNTTIPVRRSDSFSTSENNQTMVEVHVVQGEREMATDNKSLGRFKLMGIPPAPRGIPQVQVAFDIDANGILQVTAMDRTTGREQGITIQGASNLNEAEINRMVQEAELYADQDRQKRDRIEKRTKAEALTYESERQLREVALDFGMQFASSYRRRIENLVQDLRGFLKQDDDRGIDMTQADLRDALYDLQREVYQLTQEEEGETDFFGSIRRTLSSIGEDLFGDDDEYYDDRRDNYGRDAYSRDAYSRDAYDRGGSRDSYSRDAYSRDDSSRDSYSRDAYSRDSYSRDSSRDDAYDRGSRDAYPAENYPRDTRDSYTRDRASREVSPRNSRDSYSSDDREAYDRNERDTYSRDTYSRDTYGREGGDRTPYPREGASRGSDRDVNGREGYRDGNSRDSYPQDRYPQDRDGRRPADSVRRPPANPNTGYTDLDDGWDDDDEWLS
ncbi:MAG: molecular chaperone DnaK [Drouetiella hepatica Uher 2000/2452]|jgi:molecular chaperone DnaK|uniref:Chaperone protein DnaK n=1 Tax=Drouetiella hepatica Uher 2000/2452 TaxID=904376 RepID=A0A951QBR1_9CYAN|nr:molecular chaperone DnaK [Drouetiella hepatica Uher 2000/2452]